ncbi:MAG: hypothetical protein FJZ01_28430, partial [Candidatus Sericytochromatia bacterium]|nr:hypothetical protein [Candidatus Tanganyikabacteria bacterium]
LNSATPSFAVQALPDTFDRATYRVTGGSLGTPRDGRLAVEGASGRGSALLVDLPPAEYLVSISARDAGGLELASGSATVSVQAAVTATASVLLAYPGRASLGLELPQGEGPTPSFRVNRL